MRYSFYQVYSDPTVYTLPITEELEAAIQKFAKRSRVQIESISREDAWMVTPDRTSVRYRISQM
ncbi:hypothetical protein [Alicyclobacillus sp. SO9]|uniref:hypothetical protein n=1 Tax=Alicyclobacillus sp. SO9 TaxID=2665646 RepID=UPI0018E8D49F|nr:hypothetical protein [Alicyclobacillus sp. SO9]QQE81544.1 hypothetical protein GI364_24910 [Alicyclobacillus sp. SO9]